MASHPRESQWSVMTSMLHDLGFPSFSDLSSHSRPLCSGQTGGFPSSS